MASIVDKVRSSRDGHQYHEAWLARRALGLLLPQDELCGIAIEGLSPRDQKGANAASIEIADATFYFGKAPNFRDASRIEIAQFKYSIARNTVNFVCSDAKKTLEKFAKTEADFLSKPKQADIVTKISYAIYTNRPIAPELIEAISALAQGTVPSNKKGRVQYNQLLIAIPLNDERRKTFAAKLSLVGSGGDLRAIEKGNASIIADWSASNDAVARARLGGLRQLVRDKAGHTGQHKNVITNIDVLAELEIGEETELLPAPQAFAQPGPVVEREQLRSFIDGLGPSGLWVVHAAGGVGKTVFAQSAASRLGTYDEVVLFDCFGGGAYRSPLDTRHRPERGLMHIVNELACRGLCDPLLPGANDPTEVVRRSIQRFRQAIDVLRRARPTARLVIVMDAADNAAKEAKDRGQSSFPQMLLESLSYISPIDGLLCIATARTERRDSAIGRSQCSKFQLNAFSPAESKLFIKERRPEATSAQIEAIHRRSNGNPRVIANLIEPDRSLAEVDTATKVDLDDLIRERIARAIKLADDKGAARDEVAAFLCALSVLPPPVPIEEMAAAFGITVSEVESFASDLSPLLERTRHGLIFRDEPTETLVRETYGQQLSLLDGVVVRLTDAQATSVYAARSLPGLLFAMGKTDLLQTLAFDTRFPPELDSDLAKRAIRLNRLRTAVGAAAKARDFSACVDLLVELAALVIVDERGEDYILEHPDLVVGLGDPEALRRLFEARTNWPGRRYARLAIAYVADGDTAEAFGHAVRADDWQRWYQDQDEQKQRDIGIEPEDYAAIAFYLFAKTRSADVARYIAFWRPHYGYLVASRLFEHCAAAEAFGNLPKFTETLNEVVGLTKAPPALIAAAFSAFPSFASRPIAKGLLRKLSAKLKGANEFPEEYASNREEDSYRRSLLRCAMRMVNLSLAKEAGTTLTIVEPKRYGMWLLREAWHTDQLVPWALCLAARCANEARTADLFDCLPKELWALVEDTIRPQSDEDQRKLLDARLAELKLKKGEITSEIEDRRKKSGLAASEEYHASDRITRGVVPLLKLVRHLTNIILAVKSSQVKTATSAYFDAWKSAQSTASERGSYIPREQLQLTNALYQGCVSEILTALDLFTPEVAQSLDDCLADGQSVTPERVINFVRRLAARPKCHTQAGKMAGMAVRGIEREDDVQRRTQLFARLSRALVPANLTEASQIFKRGLKELDAIGSGDYDFAYELLNFAATLRGEPLQPALALRLAKICEINVYDSHKWDWPLTSRAFAQASGPAFLAQIARWHDRAKVDLNLTLPSALTYLVKNGSMRSDVAVPLLWLVDPQTMWHWGWQDLVGAFLAQGPIESLADELLDQYERSFPGRSSSHYLHELRKAFEPYPLIAAKVADRITRFEQRATRPRKIETQNHSPTSGKVTHPSVDSKDKRRQAAVSEALANVDPADPESFESFVEKLEELPGWPDDKAQAFKTLRDRVAYADRSAHMEAIVGARNLELSEKLNLLQAVKVEWTKDSPTQLEFISSVGLRMVREHAEELLSKKWGFTTDLFKVSEITGVASDELAIALVEAATSRELNAAAMTWLNLASILSKRADAAAPCLALERLLDSGAARLADDIGDGQWREELNAGSDPDQIAAGLVWFGLGSPVAKERWRAAHAARSMARFGQWTVIERLFGLLSASDAGAFQDRSLPFFKLHAHLWFLLAVARIALDFPSEIARFSARLEAIALDNSFPHVGIREAACQALRHCFAGKHDAIAKKLLAKIAKINESQFRQVKTRGERDRDFPWERPKDIPEPFPQFYFDYDFEKSNISSLADVFGLPKWRAGDLCKTWVQKWAPKVTSMNEFSGRQRPYSQNGYYRATEQAYQSHGTYLAWHAVAVVGGQLLTERPVTDDSYHDDPWQDWVSEYRITRMDGYWAADGTGSYPLVALNDLRAGTGPEAERDVPTSDKTFLAALVGLGDKASLPEQIIVEASWSSPDNTSLSVVSALVDPLRAELAALAVATSPPFHMWLPSFEHYEEDEPPYRQDGMKPCEPWITRVQRSENLDERDPFGSSSAMSIHQPAKSVIAKFELSTKDRWSRTWMQKNGSAAFQYSAWGGWEGDGDSEKRNAGHALYCDRGLLSRVLTDLDRSLIVLVKLQRYHEAKRFGDDNNEERKFTNSFLVAIVDKGLNVTVVEPSQVEVRAISALDQYAIHDFEARLRVLDATRLAAKQP